MHSSLTGRRERAYVNPPLSNALTNIFFTNNSPDYFELSALIFLLLTVT